MDAGIETMADGERGSGKRGDANGASGPGTVVPFGDIPALIRGRGGSLTGPDGQDGAGGWLGVCRPLGGSGMGAADGGRRACWKLFSAILKEISMDLHI